MLNVKAVTSLLILFGVIAGLIFASVRTLRYWQGWTFLLVYFAASLALLLLLGIPIALGSSWELLVDCSNSAGPDLAAARRGKSPCHGPVRI